MHDNAYTTEDLAAMLDRVQSHSSTDWKYLSALNGMVVRLAYTYPRLKSAQQNFSDACANARGASESSKKWGELKRCATELAIMVRTLGNITLTLCPKHTQHGPCRVPLTTTGECRGVVPHKR